MSDKKKYNNLVNITIGIIMIIFNMAWMYSYTDLIYGYYFTSQLYLFMLPLWILIMNIIVGLIGIYLAIMLIKKKSSPWTAVPVNIGLICFCILIELSI